MQARLLLFVGIVLLQVVDGGILRGLVAVFIFLVCLLVFLLFLLCYVLAHLAVARLLLGGKLTHLATRQRHGLAVALVDVAHRLIALVGSSIAGRLCLLGKLLGLGTVACLAIILGCFFQRLAHHLLCLSCIFCFGDVVVVLFLQVSFSLSTLTATVTAGS